MFDKSAHSEFTVIKTEQLTCNFRPATKEEREKILHFIVVSNNDEMGIEDADSKINTYLLFGAKSNIFIDEQPTYSTILIIILERFYKKNKTEDEGYTNFV